jgi:hypothetical protein
VKRTSNAERRTPNVERQKKISAVIVLLAVAFICTPARADQPIDLERAAQPLADGVPEVAVVRLRELLRGKLTDEQRRRTTLRLAQALVASEQYAEAAEVLERGDMRDELGTRFLLAQALAGVGRWSDALPLYKATAVDSASPFRTMRSSARPKHCALSAAAMKRCNRSVGSFATSAGRCARACDLPNCCWRRTTSGGAALSRFRAAANGGGTEAAAFPARERGVEAQ